MSKFADALAAGYTKQEIVSFLRDKPGYGERIDAALSEGYSEDEVADFLHKREFAEINPSASEEDLDYLAKDSIKSARKPKVTREEDYQRRVENYQKAGSGRLGAEQAATFDVNLEDKFQSRHSAIRTPVRGDINAMASEQNQQWRDAETTLRQDAGRDRTFGEAAHDVGAQLLEGVHNIAGAIPNMVAPNSKWANFHRKAADFWRSKQSEPIKARMELSSRAIDKAGEDGVIAQVVEAASQYWDDPALASRFVVTNLPSMLPGIGAVKLAQAAALARGATAAKAMTAGTVAAAGTNAALNAGGARGEAFEDIKNTLMRQGMDEQEATSIASRESMLPGFVGGVTGAISGGSGLERVIAGGVGKPIRSALAELAGEQVEEVTPKLATNLMAGQHDDRPVSQDVGRTMVETAIGSGPGAVLAGGMSALEGRQQPDPIGGQQPDITMPEAQPIQGTPNAAGVVTQPVPAQPPIQSAPVPTGSFAQMDEFAVFMQQEQADIAQRRERLSGVQAERQLPVLQQRMESDLETMDARVSDARQRTAAESRLADLEAAMQSPNPMATFAELRTSKNQPVLPEDAAIIKRRMGQVDAFQNDLPPAIEPSLPDEGMSQFVPELAAAPADTVTGTTQHIAQIKLVNDALAAGYKLQGRALVHPKTGKKINLNRVQREHLARIKRGAANGTDGGGLEVDDGGSRDGQGNQPGGSKGLVPGLDDQPGPADTGTPGGGQQPAAPVADAGGTDVPRLKIGKTPNSAEPVTVRDGVIYIGDYPAQNYETGEDVTTTDTSQAGIKRALSDAGAMPNGIRLFAEKAEQVLPAPLPETGAPGTATTAQTQQGEDAPQQGAMVKKPRLTVEFNGEVFDVESIQDAADKWNRFVETSMGGVSQVGNGVTIKEDGKPIARVSYNGRIWDMDENEIVFDQKKKAPTQQDTRAKLKAEVEKAKAEPETGTGTGTRTKRKQRPSNNLIQRIKQLGGINIKYLSDVTGERTTKGLPVGLFQYMRRKGTVITNGHGLDTLATELAADGFPINIDDDTDNGGVNQLTELIRSAISGRPVLNYAGQEDAIMQDAARQEREILFEKADELGVNAPRSIKTEVLRARIDAEIAKLEKEVSDAGEAVADDYDDIPFTQEELSAAKTGSEDDLFGDLYDGQETEAGSEAQAGAVAEGRTPEGAATDRAQEGPEETDAQEGFSLTAPSAEELKAAEKESARKAKEEADKIKADEMRGDFALTGSDRETDKAAAQGAQELFGLPRNAKEAGAQVASGVASARKGLSESDAAMAEVESVIRSFAGKNTVEFAEAMTRWASRGNDQLLQAYVDRIGFDMDRMLANGATQATVRNVMYAELHKEAKRLASLETKPATSMETPAAQRKATIEERIASEKASHVLDLNKAQTGWKRIDDANNEAVTLVSYDGKIAVPFLTKDKKSGAASVRMNAEAHAYAIDNPYRAAPIPEGELIANPLYGEAESTAGQPAATTAQPAQSKPASAQSTKPAVSANTVFTEDAAAAARARLKAKLGRLNTGLDPETMLDGITLAGYHIEKGARTFAAYAKAMVEDLGDAVKPYLKSWYAAVSMDPRASGFDGLDDLATVQSAYLDAILKETGDTNEPDQRSSTDLERNRQDSGTQDGVGAQGVLNDGGRNGGTGGQGVLHSETNGIGKRSDRVSGREASTTGAQGDFSPFAETPGTEERASGSDDGSGSGSLGFDGPTIEPEGTSQTDAVAQGGLGLDLKRIAQAKAENIEVRPGDRENIAETLPFLMQGQQDDVAFAENRFAKPNGYGVLFTNGTGTGKTASGLGIVKRFARQGKTNTLIVVPSDKIASDWIAFGKNLKLDIAMLADTNDAGQGIVITTYANFGANDALVRRKWDLVVTDESHYLMQAKDGKNTLAIDKLRAITMHPRGEYARYAALYRAEIDEEHRLREKVRSNNKVINLDDTTFEQAEQLRQANKKYEDRIDELAEFLAQKRAEVRDDVDAAQGEARPRAVFLSATPFAYEKTVDYAEGYLFDYPKIERSRDAYNSGSPFDRFMMQHFGYRMRNNKLTEPGPEVNRGLMQRAFNSWLKSEKVLSGRMLDVEHDYDRKFILVDSAIGAELDRAMQWIWDRANDGNNPNKEGYSALQSALSDKFAHLTRRYLLEAIKAKEAIPIIRRHLDLGRKVVVFHDFKKGGGFNPVRFGRANENADTAEGVKNAQAYNAAVDAFNSEFSGLIESPMWATASPIDALSQAFPDALLFNGDVPAKKRRDNVALFQDDNSGRNLIIGQAAAMKEGVSLHDTTGKHQRVLINLGLPTQPTTSIQQEGRIFRVGQASNAMFRYLNTGTNWERFAFATSIAQRASAAENLAVGEEARALMDAFIEGFEESDTYAPGHEGEGTGGKARDKAANQALTEWDRAMTMYWAQAKKNSRTKALEGVDYFATPEPLGLKMVEWADIRDGDKALEPSAGHGAIARWLPDNISRTVVEPSSELASRLKMVVGDARLLQERFEDLDTKANKYDAIVMNPPFGSGGSTAIQHVAKAAKHLNNGGRIVALIPTGPAADAKFGKWLYGEEQRPAKPLGTIPGSDKQYFVGDTVSLIDGSQYSIEGKGSAGVMLRPLAGGIPEGWRSHYFQEVTPGPRTESVKLAPNLYLRADIKLPQVTFERAGTSVAARVVVIEKQTDKDAAAKIQQVNRDYSDAENIKDFFERIKDSSIPARAMPETASPATPGKPATEGKKLETDAEEITYTTKKGKVLHGVIAKGITEAQAKEYDPYTWKKDGGFFIRMEHVKRPGETAKFSRAQPQVADPHTIKSFKTAIDAAEGNGFADKLEATGNVAFITSEELPETLTGGDTQYSLSSEYEVQPDTTPDSAINGAKLTALRRAAAGIESPERGITFRVDEEGRAIVTGPARTKVPSRFQRFANEHGLTLVVRRGPTVGARGSAMPITSREAGALYFGEIANGPGEGGAWMDRTGKTRFSVAPDIRYSKDGRILAFVKDGKVHFVTDNISQAKDSVPGLLRHEIAVHALRLNRSDKEFQAILRDLRLMRDSGNVKVKAAYAAVPKDTPASLVDEEALGYLTEKNPEQSLAKRFIAWLRNVLRKLAGDWANTLTVDDLVWMAGKALRTAPERMAGTGDGMAMSRREKAPWYYSALAKAVDAMPAKVDGTSAMNVKAWLLANADKQGVKRDEIQWSGITDYLDLRGKNKVTKAEIADYLSGNGVTVQDVVKADDPMPDMTPLSEHEIAEYEDMRSRIRANPTRNVLSNNERLRFNDLARRYSQVESYPKARKHTKFSGYWESSYKGGIPGTYREILVTLPELEGPVPDGWVVKEGKADGRVPALMYHAVKQDGPAANKPLSEIEGRFIFYSAETRKELYRRIRTRNGTEYPGLSVNPANFNSPHWDEPNVLVHVRLDEVFGADGKRYVRVGEVQSDWGQKGKKEGFARPNDAALLAEQKELRNRKDGITAKWGGLHGLLVATKTDPVAAAEKAEKDAIDVRLREIEEALGNIPMAGAIRGAAPPSAPFVTDTKAWVALGIKRAIMHAIDVGADGVVFGTGRQNADLYDLSKQVDRVRITPTGGVWSVTAWKDGNQVLSKDASDESELAEFVGKELAEKAVNEKGGDYSGLDLQVGGSGMRAFYDKIVPSVANEVLRKIGVEKAVSIETEGGKQPGFTIPDAMREKIDNEGLPLFSKTIKSDIGNIIENPTRDQAENLLRRARYGAMRGLRDPETGKLYIWDAADAIHHQAAREIGITDDVYERLEFGDVDTLPRGVFSGEPGYGRVIADRASAYDVVMYSRRLDDTAPSGPVWDAPVKSTGWENIVYELQDKHIDTKRVVEAIKKSGEYIDPEWNPHLQEQLFHGRSAKGVDDFLNDELRPLVEAMAKAGVNQEDLNAYLHARHAKERNEAMKAINEDREDNDGLSGLTDEEADAVLESFSDRADTMEDLANHVDRMIAGTRRMLVGYGLETQETISGWAEKYEHYVPLHREGFPQTPGTGQGYSIRGKFSKLATGSHLPVDNILAHVAMQRERAIVRGEKNRVSMALYSLALLNPNKAFWSVDKVAEEVVTDPDTGLPIVMAGDIGDIKVPRIKAIDKATGQVMYYPDPTYKGRGNVVVARINGKDYAVIFNERNERAMRMAESLKNLDIDPMHDWLGKFGAVTRYFAAINTQYNPVFGLWNLMRDVSMAALNLSSTPIANKRLEVMSDTSKALAGIYQDARAVRNGKKPSSAWADLWEQFQQDGGQTGYRDLFRTSKDRADAIQHMLDPEWWQKTWPGKVVTAGGLLAVPEKVLVDKVGRAMFDWLSDFNLTMENAIRLAAYKVALDDGMDRQEAAALAKNLTVNFNKKGRSSTSLGALFAFFNASVQGTARIAETIYKDGKMTEAGQVIVLGGITMGAMQALALALAGFDEDEPPEWIKERSLVIPVPGTEKGYVAYPYPLGYHVLPNIGRHLMEYMLSGFEDPGKRVVNLVVTAMNAFNPLGSATVAQMATPTVFDPLVALAENQDFTGKPIYREDISSLRPTPGESRAKDSATVIGRGVAIAANRLTGGTKYTPGWFSPTPDQIDYLLGQLTGGVGREAGKLEQTVTGLVTGDLAPMYKVPILGRMAGSASSEFAQRDRFYRNLTELNTLQAELKGRREERQNTIEFRREHPELRMLGDAAEIQAQMRVYKKSGKRYDERLAKRIKRFNEKYAELQSSN